MSRPQFFLVAGPNGAGKSTLTLTIRKRYPSVQVIDPDANARDLSGSFATVDQEQLAAQAKASGFRTTFIYVGLSSAELSAERVGRRVGLGGHAIPLDDVARRYPRSLNNLKAHIQSFESAHIYDNSVRYQWVCDYRDGLIHKVSRQMPEWIRPYLP